MDTPRLPKRRRTWPRLLLGLLALLTAAVAGVFYLRAQLAPVSPVSAPREFEVLPGWGAARIAQALEREGLVRDARVFGYYLRYRGLERSLGEGLYQLDPSMSAEEIAAALERGGRPRAAFVVIPEGFRLQDVARRLERDGLGDESSWLELMREPGALRPSYAPEDATLEGYLFPAGYQLPLDSTPEAVLRPMLERFDEELEQHREALAAAGLSVPAWVTLASMVQAEAANPKEMPIIAGVFLNRLEREMPLQSDPTVAYGLGKSLPQLDALAGDLTRDHPWNTYTRQGLPYGPIDNPGEDALEAVLSPQRSDEAGRPYLYFLHGSDAGQPVFRPNATLEEHERDIERYLR